MTRKPRTSSTQSGGRTDLYVVQNEPTALVAVELSAGARRGQVTQRVTDPRFDVPSTVARGFQDRLYVVNARFSTPPTPATPYSAISIPRP